MFILTSLTLPLAARTAFSSTGVSCRHGPHHSAQTSIRTGWRRDSSTTSFTKPGVVGSVNRRVLIDVHLDQLDLALGGAHRLLQHRRELPARAAPLGPEVDQDRLAPRFLDDILHEALGGGFLDQIGRPLRRRAAALLYYRHG